ncbi:MAG: hypothetical protein HY011_25450 [Acidobacteria bacterium]|nr:hypothetical protein [Acidobacteriota bacterium]
MQYVSVEDQKRIAQTYRTTVIIVLAFCFTPLLLVGLGYFIGAKGGAIRDAETYLLMTKVAYSGALIAGLAVVALRRFWMSFMRGVANSVPATLSKLRILALLSAGLGEVVAIIGFIAFSLSGDYQFCWRLGVVGLLLMLYGFPRRWEWERLLAARAQA